MAWVPPVGAPPSPAGTRRSGARVPAKLAAEAGRAHRRRRPDADAARPRAQVLGHDGDGAGPAVAGADAAAHADALIALAEGPVAGEADAPDPAGACAGAGEAEYAVLVGDVGLGHQAGVLAEGHTRGGPRGPYGAHAGPVVGGGVVDEGGLLVAGVVDVADDGVAARRRVGRRRRQRRAHEGGTGGRRRQAQHPSSRRRRLPLAVLLLGHPALLAVVLRELRALPSGRLVSHVARSVATYGPYPRQRRPHPLSVRSGAAVVVVRPGDGHRARAVLDGYIAGSPQEAADLDRMLELAGHRPVEPGRMLHFTGSAFVVHPPTRVLLRWHARQPLQVGGHADPGERPAPSPAAGDGWSTSSVARRAPAAAASSRPDQRHRARHEHADLRFVLATAEPDAARPEQPSGRLRWLTVAEAMALTTEANVRESLARIGRRSRRCRARPTASARPKAFRARHRRCIVRTLVISAMSRRSARDRHCAGARTRRCPHVQGGP